ncbi:Alcohol acetyltransferase [Paraconiothyrium brasiliense]|uniref:Alcohol acetyltransferase n=1 Tax=Paraconiothyrium brasiliense TaxID=300254 RepID=A0ABR3QQV9_9PLEO
MDKHARIGVVTSGDAGTKIRDMGCHEAYQVAMHTLDQYRGTIVACSYAPPPKLMLSEDLSEVKAALHDAVSRLILGQPHLHVRYVGENTKNPVFVRIDHLDLRKHILWSQHDESQSFEQSYLDYVQTQLDSRFEYLPTEPGWKLTVLHQPGKEYIELLYVWNHPHHDGMGGKIFHQHLLRHLNEAFVSRREPLSDSKFVDGSDRCILKIPDPTSKLPPNPELLSWWPMTPLFFVKALWKEIKPQWIFPPGDTHAHWAPIQLTPFATRFRNFTIENSVVTRVIDACRQHNTTITGLVQALVLVSLTASLENSKGFASRTPYDLRHILPSQSRRYPWLQPKETICNYVSVIEHEFNADLVATIRATKSAQRTDRGLSTDLQDIIWTVSARVRREIETRLDSGLWNDLIGVMKLCSNWLTQQESEAHKTRYLSWLVTNLGVIDGRSGLVDRQDGWSLRWAELLLSAEIPSAAFSVSMMTVKERDLVVTCSWQDCVLDASLGEQLMVDLEQWLKEIGA